ncbi:MAG: hypothetical protein ACREBP_09890, partial [Sphingomicrobium sp.]
LMRDALEACHRDLRRLLEVEGHASVPVLDVSATRGDGLDALLDELARLPDGGSGAIPNVRALQRRLLMLAPARARLERGERPDDVMASMGKSLFWRDKALFGAMLRRWSAADIAYLFERSGKTEQGLLFGEAPQQEALGEELLAVARAARRR